MKEKGRANLFLHVAGVAASRPVVEQPVSSGSWWPWTRADLLRKNFALFDGRNRYGPLAANRGDPKSSSVYGASLKRPRKRHALHHFCIVGVGLDATSGKAIQIRDLRTQQKL